MTPSLDILTEALRYRRMGISIIPIGKNKKPALSSWKHYQTDAAEEFQINDWFDRNVDFGLGIVLGKVSGDLVVRDFDVRESWEQWVSEYPLLARSLPYVESSPGKRHFYCRILDCRSQTFDDGEIRASGSYVVAPPSIHPDSHRYKWGRDFDTLADVPTLTLDQSGFGHCWLPSDRQPTNDTDRTEVDLFDLCLSVTWPPLIEATLRHAFGMRRRKLFELARRIRANQSLRDVPLCEFRPLLLEWHRLALPFIRTKPFDETWSDFIEGFGNVDLARCGDAAAIALAAADAKALPVAAFMYDIRQVQRLVGLCAELGGNASDGVFYLSCRKAAKLLGVTEHGTVARWIRMLIVDRVLKEVVKGGPHTNQASRYECVGK